MLFSRSTDLSDIFAEFSKEFEDMFANININCRLNHTMQGFTLTLDVPGVKEEDLSVSLQGSTLLITGKRGDQKIAKRHELNDQVDLEAITAKLEYGVLTITLPKKPTTKPRKITIQKI